MSLKKLALRFWKTFLEEHKNLETAIINKDKKELEEIKKILSTYFEEMSNCQLEIEEEDGIFELTFLPEQEKNAQLVCALLKKTMPKKLQEKWVVHSELPPLSQKAMNTILRIQNQEYTADDFYVCYEIDTNNHCVNVEIFCDAFQSMDPSKALEIAVYMLQLYIGETALEAYINHVDVIDNKKEGNISLLSYFYEMLMDIVVEQKWTMYEDATSIYRLFHLDDEDKINLNVREDMKLISSLHPLLISETLENQTLIANQFYDLGGEYGYVYYEHSNNEKADIVVRQTLEKKLNEIFYEHHTARTIGGAIGLKYAYIDLAIFDKDEFLKILPLLNNKLSTPLIYKAFNL